LNLNALDRPELAGATEFLELGIPRESVSVEQMRQIRIIAITTLAVCGVGLPSVLQFISIDMKANALATLVAIGLGFANLGLLRATRNPLLCGHVGVALFALITVVDSSATGGYYAPNFSWIYLIPLAAAVLVGFRGLVIWTAITLLANVGFWSVSRVGFDLVNQVPPEAMPFNALFTRILAIMTLAAMSASFVIAQRRAERQQQLLHERMIRESGYVELLMTAAVTANQATSFKDALDASVQEICESMKWAGGHVCKVGENGSVESTGTVYLVDREAYQPLVDMTFDPPHQNEEAIARLAVAMRKPIFVDDFEPDDPRPRRALAYDLGLRAAIAVPILVGGEVRAVIEFVSTKPLVETDHLGEVFSHVGVQLGRVAERTALEERLRHSQKMEAVGQLAAGLAHEINNPMSYVRSNLNALRSQWAEFDGKLAAGSVDTQLQEQLGDCAELIEDSIEGVERTIEIVRNVRDYSHLHETGDAVFEDSDLSILLDGALRIARSDTPSGVLFEVDLAEVPPCPCIPGQIRQVFVNLIVNAIQAVGAAGRIRLETDHDGQHVVARVIDDGPGIAPSTIARMFDPFFTTKGVGEGTGLGLSVSYEIVHRHGGSIDVQSVERSGSQFEVRLPLSR
jgi:signal transduction histidine kinase